METKIFYSIFSGIIYDVCADEVNVLDDGQIPLISRPKVTCNKCYGRGYHSFNSKQNIYNGCPCLRKHVDPDYKPKEVQIPIEKFT